ncbi:hypothetical protein HED60_23140 [Planctomycetales bacterium ZRK34]|nr:hypothetical protein HED60_23140 [Planctomycetales bacterium ZRK34]
MAEIQAYLKLIYYAVLWCFGALLCRQLFVTLGKKNFLVLALSAGTVLTVSDAKAVSVKLEMWGTEAGEYFHYYNESGYPGTCVFEGRGYPTASGGISAVLRFTTTHGNWYGSWAGTSLAQYLPYLGEDINGDPAYGNPYFVMQFTLEPVDGIWTGTLRYISNNLNNYPDQPDYEIPLVVGDVIYSGPEHNSGIAIGTSYPGKYYDIQESLFWYIQKVRGTNNERAFMALYITSSGVTEFTTGGNGEGGAASVEDEQVDGPDDIESEMQSEQAFDAIRQHFDDYKSDNFFSEQPLTPPEFRIDMPTMSGHDLSVYLSPFRYVTSGGMGNAFAKFDTWKEVIKGFFSVMIAWYTIASCWEVVSKW